MPFRPGVVCRVSQGRTEHASYLDLIEAALGEAARKALAMLPQGYQFQGPSYQRGRVEGRVEGEANSIVAFLEARGIAVSAEQRERILTCSDPKRMEAWIRRAATLVDTNELFES